jgi:hypothetical protein
LDQKLFKKFVDEFRTLSSTHPGLILYITPLEAWYLLAQLQLALRHPKNNGKSYRYAKNLALAIQFEIARTPALNAVASRGWNSLYDAHIPNLN